MRNTIYWTWIWVILGILVFLSSVIVDYVNHQFNFVQRSGGLVTLFGAFAGARSILRNSLGATVMGRTIIGGGGASDEPFIRHQKEAKANIIGERTGLMMAAFGVIISGYGDLLWNLIQQRF